MKDWYNSYKFKNITEKRSDTEGKVIKNHLDVLNILNQITEEGQDYSDVISLSTNNLSISTETKNDLGCRC